MKTFVISMGGSIVVPSGVDTDFVSLAVKEFGKFLKENKDIRIIFVIGGGATARLYQNAAKKINADISDSTLDWIGIRATHLNAEVVNAAFGSENPVVTDPLAENIPFKGQVLVAGGAKPGFSTDTDSIYLAKHFNSSLVINLSNIDRVYTANPKTDKNAKPIDDISWADFIKNIVGTKWVPGSNVPFDPIASALARDSGISVICADGRNLENTMKILKGGTAYIGTLIHS